MKNISSCVVRGACVLLAFCSFVLSRAQQQLPVFSTEENPVYYYIQFENSRNFLRCMGEEDNIRTATSSINLPAPPAGYYMMHDGVVYNPATGATYQPEESDAEIINSWAWAFVDFKEDTQTFLMKTKPFSGDTEGKFLSFTGERFVTTGQRDDAVRMKFLVQDGTYSLQLQREGSSLCMNQFGSIVVGQNLGEWYVNSPNNYFNLIQEADLVKALLFYIDSRDVKVGHKDSYYFERVDENPDLAEAAARVGFISSNNPRRVTEHDYQNVNTREREIFVKQGTSVNLYLPNYLSNNVSGNTRSAAYQRWYDYETDGLVTEGGLAIDGNIKRVIIQQNGYVLGSNGNVLSGTSCGQYATYYMPVVPEGEPLKSYTIACDLSRYTDYTQIPGRKGLTEEPTLDARAIYHIKDARVMAEQLKECTGDQWFEDKEIHFPSLVNCNLFGQTLPLRYDGRNYYAYNADGTDIEHSQLQVSIEDPHDLGITLRENTVGDNAHYLNWGYPTLATNSVRAGIRNATGTNDDYVIIKAVMTVGGKTYNIARYKVYFDPNTEPRPIMDVLGNRESMRSPEYMRSVAGEPLTEQSYDYDHVPYIRPGEKNERANTYAFPRPYANVSYGYSFIDSGADESGGGINANNGEVSWGEYSVVHKLKLPQWGSTDHQTVFEDISTIYYDWYLINGTDEEKAIYCKDDREASPGYFVFIDASERPGQIANIPLQKNLCGGTKIYVSAWVGSGQAMYSGDVSRGKDGVVTNAAPASISFDFIGIKGGEEKSIYRFCPGQISGFHIVNDNGADRFVCPATGEPGLWKQVAFSFIVDEVYESYELRLENNCKSSNGGDILLDQIQVFVRSPKVEMKQIAPVCGNQVQHFKVSADFGSILSAVGLDEVTSTDDREYQKFDCFYCFIDKEKFDAEFMNPDGSRKEYTEADYEKYREMFGELVVGDMNAPIGDPRSAAHEFVMSNMYKDRLQYSLREALKMENESSCFWEDLLEEDGSVSQRNIVFTSRILADGIKPDKDYYIVFRVGGFEQEDGSGSVGDVSMHILFDLLNECVVTDSFTLRPSTMTKIDGEIVPDGEVSYCAGTVPTIKVSMEGLGEDGNIERPNDSYDWYLGPMDQFNGELLGEGTDAVSLAEVLTNFRHHYPDRSSAEGAEPRTDDPNFMFTAGMRDWLVELSTRPVAGKEPLLQLYRNALSYALGLEPDVEYRIVVIPRDRSELELEGGESEDGTEKGIRLFCYEPKEIVIRTRPGLPNGYTGLHDVRYPDNYASAPLRISLSQISEVRETAGNKNRLVIPLRQLIVSDKDAKIYKFRKADDVNIYVSRTNDTSFEPFLHDDATGEDYMNPVGTLVELDAVVGTPDEEKDNRVVMQFSENFKPREGFSYDLRIAFRELSSDATKSSCGGHMLIPVKIVPEYQVWTGDAGNTDWNNDSNWRRADRAELLPAGDAYRDYTTNEDNYSAMKAGGDITCYAPIRTTSVVVPAEQTIYPVLTDRYAPATEADLNPDEEQPASETANIRYDLVADDVEDGYAGIAYYSNRCKEVNFQPAAEMLHSEKLSYEKAWVEYELKNNRWYTLGTPLQGMFSGEWYAPTAGARQQTPYFMPVSWDRAVNDRFGPAVYQHSWDKAVTNVYRVDGSEGDNPWNVAVLAEWSNVYNDVNVAYGLGGFSVKVVPMRATGVAEDGNSLFRFPKADGSYTYYQYNESGAGDRSTAIDRKGAHYRLYSDSLAAPDKLYFSRTFENASADNAYFLVGNPFVCGLDMSEFFNGNPGLEKKYYVVADNTQTVYVKDTDNGHWVASDGTSSPAAVVAPLQGFFVKNASGTPLNRTEVKFTAAMMGPAYDKGVTLKTRPFRGGGMTANNRPAGLVVTASRGDMSSRALLTCSPDAADDYVSGEEAELLLDAHLVSGVNSVPAVYTVAGNSAVSINRVRSVGRIPLGVAGNDRSDVTLRFDGVESLGEEVQLYDAATDLYVPLRSGLEVTVPGITSGRYFLTGALQDAVSASAIAISVSGTTVTLKSSSGESLTQVRVTDAGGRVIHECVPSGSEYAFRLEKGVYVIEARTATATLRTKILL